MLRAEFLHALGFLVVFRFVACKTLLLASAEMGRQPDFRVFREAAVKVFKPQARTSPYLGYEDGDHKTEPMMRISICQLGNSTQGHPFFVVVYHPSFASVYLSGSHKPQVFFTSSGRCFSSACQHVFKAAKANLTGFVQNSKTSGTCDHGLTELTGACVCVDARWLCWPRIQPLWFQFQAFGGAGCWLSEVWLSRSKKKWFNLMFFVFFLIHLRNSFC